MLSSASSKPLFIKTTSLTLLKPFTLRRSFTISASARVIPNPPDLIQWIRREGGSVHPNIAIADHETDGLGVVSTGNISSGSEIIEIPSHLPLRWRGDDVMLDKVAERIPEELWAMKLGLRLIQERAKVNSYWLPYISNLPEIFTMPIFFSGDEIKNLQYAPVLHQVNKRCRFLLNFEKEINTLLTSISPSSHPFEGKIVTSSALGCAMSAVSSRAFRLHGEKDESVVPMLLPLIDMCNHSFDPNARIVQDRDAHSPNLSIKVVAEKQIDENTPVTLNYGKLSNDLLLLDYGFVVPSNPYDRVELRYDSTLLEAASMTAGVSSSSFSSPATWQQEMLTHLGLLGDNAILNVTLGGPDIIDGRLLAALRILLSPDPKTLKIQNLNSLMILGSETNPPLGSSIEASALRIVISLCVLLLEHFPTKIMQDEEVLKMEVSSATRLAVEFRMQKKLMLVDIVSELSKRVERVSKEKSNI